jgi:ribonuclease HI
MDAALTSDIARLQDYLRPAVQEIEVGLVNHAADPNSNTATKLISTLRAHAYVKEINVEIAAAMLQTTLDKALGILIDLCPKKPPKTGNIHPKRTVTRAVQKLHREHVQLKQKYEAELRKDAPMEPQTAEQADTAERPDALDTRITHNAHASAEGSGPGSTLARLRDAIRRVGTDIRQALTVERKKHIAAAKRRTQHLIATRPRRAHQAIFSKDELERGLPAVRHPVTGKVCTEPESILEAVHQYFQAQAVPIGAPKTGRYRPDEAPRTYPFLEDTAPDPFSLVSPKQATDHILLSSIADPFNYSKCIHRLARNKTPGPDGLPNELLKALPDALQTTIHDLMKVMWVKAHTPTDWTESVTVLLPKPGDALLLKNKRPIALANTMYKLWTSLITVSIGDIAPELALFSEAQEGFLRYRNTERQIQNLLHVIEDAGLTRKDLYVLYVDFSSAFNTINHDLLLQIMYDLGLPEDLIHVVRDLYSQARTSVRTEHGTTAPIKIDRGTVQGDTLSPVLFIIFLEPLLRWLHAGGRGHKYGCLQDGLNARYHCSSAAYADDLAVMTNNARDLHTQCDKISLYSQWAGLHVNHTKCAATGILHHRAWADRGLNGPTCERTLKAALDAKVKISGQPVPYLPPTEPYKYLGVHVTLTLNWSAQMAHVCKAVRDKGDLLQGSLASPDQSIRIVQSCIQPVVAYSFSTMAYTANDIRLLDAMIARIARRCYGLPASFPTRAVLLPGEHYGLGVGSLLPIYVRIATRALILSLNDEGRLGTVTRALLRVQCQLAADTRMHALKRESCFYTTLKQLTLAREHGITVTDKGRPYNTSLNTLMAAASAVNAGQDAQRDILPHRCLLPLTELGLDMHMLIDKNTTKHLITTTELQKLFPRGKVQHRHKVALNRLSLAISAQCPQAPHTEVHDPRRWPSALPLEDRRLREIPDNPQYTGLRHKTSLPIPVLTPSLGPHVSRDTPVVWSVPTRKPRQNRAEPGDLECDPPQPPNTPVEPAHTGRKRTRSVRQRQQDFINNNTRCDNKEVGTENAAIHWAQIHDPTPEHRTSYMEARRFMTALRKDTSKSVPSLGIPSGPVVHGPRPHPHPRSRHKISIEMVPTPDEETRTGVPNPVLAYLAEKGLDCTPVAPRNNSAGARVGDINDNSMAAEKDNDDELATLEAAGTPSAHPLRPAKHPNPQWWKPRWKVAREQILEDVVPWKPGKGKVAEDTTGQQQVVYDLYNEAEDIAEVIAGPITKRVEPINVKPPKRQKIGTSKAATHEQYYKVRWNDTIIPLSIVGAYASMGYVPNQLLPVTGRYGKRMDRYFRRAVWEPTDIPAAHLERLPSGHAALARYQQKRMQSPNPHPRYPKPNDISLSNQQRQGQWDPPPLEQAQRARLTRANTTFENAPCNPYTDTIPMGRYHIQIGLLTSEGHMTEENSAFVYDPKGKCVGTLSLQRLETLRRRYNYTMETYPEVHRSLVAHGGFAEDVARLLLRYGKDPDGRVTKGTPRAQATMDGQLRRTLAEALYALDAGPVIERFASPLNCGEDIGYYFSAHEEDQLFGANTDAFSRPFTGLSIAHPNPDPASVKKAAMWAVAGAAHTMTSTMPTATLLVVPHCKSGPHTELLCTPYMFHLARINRGVASTLTGGGGTDTPVPGYKGGLDLFVVANDMAIRGLNARSMNALLTDLKAADALGLPRKHLRKREADDIHGDARRPYPCKVAQMMRRMTNDPKLTGPRPTALIINHETDGQVLKQSLTEAFPGHVPLRLNPQSVIWTDGSCIKSLEGDGPNQLGAAVYCGPTGETIHIDPSGDGCTNTIQRAELSAIHAAIASQKATSTALLIATDSQASLDLIKRAINDPKKLHISKHKALLMNIAELLYECAQQNITVHFLKVKSHTGLNGNDKADEGATSVARGEASATITETADNAPFDKLFWLKQRDNSLYISDLNRAIVKRLQNGTLAGYTNDTTLTEKWRKVSANLDPKGSNAYISNTKTEHWLKLQVLKARYGLLFNAKLKKLYGRGGDGNCPVCRNCGPLGPTPDSGAHILGGCHHPTLKGMYINRHNRSTRTIADCINGGRCGGGFMIMDAGKAEDLPQYCSGTRVPKWMLPHLPEEETRRLRPDLLFIPTLATHKAKHKRYQGPANRSEHDVYIIEVGYTGDLQHAEKLAQKTTQHACLKEELTRAGWTVHYTEAQIVTLGSTGTLTNTLKPLLCSLGTTAEHAHKACLQIHKQTIEAAGAIIRTRRTLESAVK